MSDALSSASREQEKYEAYSFYIQCLIGFLRGLDEVHEECAKLRQAKRELDSLLGANQITEQQVAFARLQALRLDNKQVWAELLFWVRQDAPEHFSKLQSLSPFSHDYIFVIEYGIGFSNIKGGFEKLVDPIIKKRGWKTYDADTYVVCVPFDEQGPDFSLTEVYWIRCGISGMTGPRST